MKRKYLKDIIKYKSSYMCVPLAKLNDKKRNKKWKKQRKKYGFDERETWSMDFTLACWIYEHFKWYIDNAPIDMSFHTFKINVIDEDDSLRVEEKNVTQLEAINYVLKYLEYYFIYSNDAFEYYQAALRIVAEIMPAMWW